MSEIKTISNLISTCKDVARHGELLTLIELSKRHREIEWWSGRHPYDIGCDGLRIEVKSCNTDNEWAKKRLEKDRSFKSGFDRINPDKCDYIVCISFGKCFNAVKFYIFSSDEAKLFDRCIWKNAKNLFNIEVRDYPDQRCDNMVNGSENAWNKIKKSSSQENRK